MHFFRLLPVCIVVLTSCSKTLQEVPLSADKGRIVKLANSNRTSNVALYVAEYITTDDAAQAGQTVYFRNVGNKQLSHDFVPGDPRRGGHTNITYLIDDQTTSDNGLTVADVKGAIDNAMGTWDGVTCSDIGIEKIPFAGDLGYVQNLFGFGGTVAVVADIQHSGFLPGGFFDFVAPGGSSFILGVTFTLMFIDGDGNPTDIDDDKKVDVAFREIYYNDAFSWKTNGNIDIESIALHESGHGLSQAHFGTAFSSGGNGKLHFSPRAVMNAAYAGVQRSLLGPDNAGHCSIWASWPN